MTCSIIYSGLAFQFAMPWASVVPALSYQRGNLAVNCLPICHGLSKKDPDWQGGVFFLPLPLGSAASRENWKWPMSYEVNIGPQSWRPPDCTAQSARTTPWLPAKCILTCISFLQCRTLQLPPRFACCSCGCTLLQSSTTALRCQSYACCGRAWDAACCLAGGYIPSSPLFYPALFPQASLLFCAKSPGIFLTQHSYPTPDKELLLSSCPALTLLNVGIILSQYYEPRLETMLPEVLFGTWHLYLEKMMAEKNYVSSVSPAWEHLDHSPSAGTLGLVSWERRDSRWLFSWRRSNVW